MTLRSVGTNMRGPFAVLLVGLVAACSSGNATVRPSAPAPTRPATAAAVGVPFRVTAADGSAADVLLAGIRYVPNVGIFLSDEFAVLDVTVTGRSATTFHYDGNDFSFQYSDGPDPYQPDSTLVWDVYPDDWQAYPPALGIGDVRSGQVAHGMVPLRVEPGSRLLIKMNAGGATLAEWLVMSAAESAAPSP